jgi:hypothetical protein
MIKMPGSYLRCLLLGNWHISTRVPNLRRPHTDPDLCNRIHYKDPNQPADHRFDVEGGGLVTVTDVSNPARDYHVAGQIIRLFFDSSTVTQVWKFEVV